MFGITCRDVNELASDYLDGEMPAGRRLLFRFHLVMCSACQTFVHQIDLVRGTLPQVALDGGLSDEATARLIEQFEAQRGSGDLPN